MAHLLASSPRTAIDGVDMDTAQLSFDEFVLLLAHIARAKFPPPEDESSAEPFATTWSSFLQLLFVPKFRKLLKAKHQGAARQTIDGRCF